MKYVFKNHLNCSNKENTACFGIVVYITDFILKVLVSKYIPDFGHVRLNFCCNNFEAYTRLADLNLFKGR